MILTTDYRGTMQIFATFLFFFLAYLPCFSDDQPETIVIATYKVHGATAWDPDSIKSGITGSEEAVIYMSQQLAKLGYDVTVLGDPPKNSPHSDPSANPRYVNFNYRNGKKYDIAIAWRTPFNAMDLKQIARSVYLWPHDTYHSPLTPRQINGFEGVLWISKWQKDFWVSVNPGFNKFKPIFGNGINPDQFLPVVERKNPYSCIYGSNYGRGLEVLLEIWPKIKEAHPKATLDIYYGWQHWGLLSPEKELRMRQQITQYAPLDVREHGLVSHEELNKAYSEASFWTYPCIAPEVFCITAIRAQLAGAIPVIIDGSALPETVRYGYRCSNANEYFDTLNKALSEADKISVEQRKEMGHFILQEYTWEAVAKEWKKLFDSNKSKWQASGKESTMKLNKE